MMDISYQENGDYSMPALKMDVQPEQSIGKYGRMRKTYLKEHKSGIFQSLLLSNKLTSHLIEINEAAMMRIDLLEKQMMKAEGVNEEMKATDQMEWIRKMNNIHQSAEEITLEEIIYN